MLRPDGDRPSDFGLTTCGRFTALPVLIILHGPMSTPGRVGNALRAMNTVRQACRPVSLEELLAVTTEWVDAAMRLNDRALHTMERLIRAQSRRAAAG